MNQLEMLKRQAVTYFWLYLSTNQYKYCKEAFRIGKIYHTEKNKDKTCTIINIRPIKVNKTNSGSVTWLKSA